jgi:hypothetical protein
MFREVNAVRICGNIAVAFEAIPEPHNRKSRRPWCLYPRVRARRQRGGIRFAFPGSCGWRRCFARAQ